MVINNTKVKEKYEAQGFVEALIAILVAGIATLVLMSIAVNTLASVAHNEVTDQITQEAVKGSELLNFVVDEYNYSDLASHHFLPVTTSPINNTGNCYSLDGDFDNIVVSSAINGCKYQTVSGNEGINPNRCFGTVNTKINNTAFTIGNSSNSSVTSSDLFRVICIHPESTENVLVAKVLTGNMTCRSLNQYVTETVGVHNDCNVYEYTSIFNIKNMN